MSESDKPWDLQVQAFFHGKRKKKNLISEREQRVIDRVKKAVEERREKDRLGEV